MGSFCLVIPPIQCSFSELASCWDTESHPCCPGSLERKLWAFSELPSMRQLGRGTWDQEGLPGGGDRPMVGKFPAEMGGRYRPLFITDASMTLRARVPSPGLQNTPKDFKQHRQPQSGLLESSAWRQCRERLKVKSEVAGL